MFDDMRHDNGLNVDGRKRERRPGAEPVGPIADREVPLGPAEPTTRVLSPAIHAWLDGELPEATVRTGTFCAYTPDRPVVWEITA